MERATIQNGIESAGAIRFFFSCSALIHKENKNLSATWKAYVFKIGTSQCCNETLSLCIQCLYYVNATKWSFMSKLERKLCALLFRM